MTPLLLAALGLGLTPLEKIERYALETYPQAVVTRDERHREVTIQWKTREWVQTSGGDIAGARRTIGPVDDGFILWIAEREGPYAGVGKRPGVIDDHSWKVWLGLVEDKARNRHTLVNLSFTPKTSKGFMARIREMVQAGAGKGP